MKLFFCALLGLFISVPALATRKHVVHPKPSSLEAEYNQRAQAAQDADCAAKGQTRVDGLNAYVQLVQQSSFVTYRITGGVPLMSCAYDETHLIGKLANGKVCKLTVEPWGFTLKTPDQLGYAGAPNAGYVDVNGDCL